MRSKFLKDFSTSKELPERLSEIMQQKYASAQRLSIEMRKTGLRIW